MWIIVVILVVILFFVVFLMNTNKKSSSDGSINKQKEQIEKPKNPVIKMRSYPWFYVKDCKFYADTSTLFFYDQKDLDFLLEKYDEYEKLADYESIIKVCDEIIEVNYKIRKIWTDKINAIFSLLQRENKTWDESYSRLVVNACYGFMKTFDSSLEKSNGVKHILLPVILKNVNAMVEYQRQNHSEVYNFEVYNMLINIFYIMPYHEILEIISRYLTEDKFLKTLEQTDYVQRSLRSFSGHVEMLKSRYKVEVRENTENNLSKILINDTVIVNDEIYNTTWVGFSVAFPKDIRKAELTCKFYDERYQEIILDPISNKNYSDLFESRKETGGVEEFDIVILGEDTIKSVELRPYREDEHKDGLNSKSEKFEKEKELDKNVKEQETIKKIDEIKSNKSDYKNADGNVTVVNTEDNVVENHEEVVEKDIIEEDKNNKSEFQILTYPSFSNIKDIAISELHFICLKDDGTVKAYGDSEKVLDVQDWKDIDKVYVTNTASYGIKRDGTVVGSDKNLVDTSMYKEVLKEVVDLAPGYNHLLALRKDGTVVAIGDGEKGECDVSGWLNIVSISASFHSVGLTKDGTVVATGENTFGECNVDNWYNIIQIETGPFYTVGLKADGTVVATGLNSCSQCNVKNWENIKKIYVRGNITVGLDYNGKVVVTGNNSYRFEDIKKWNDIKDIKIVNDRIIGIKNDGRVIYKGKPYRANIERDWSNIQLVVANSSCVVGLKENGNIVCNNILFDTYIPNLESMPIDIVNKSEIGKTVVLNQDKTLDVFSKSTDNLYNWNYSRFVDISAIAMSETHLVGIKDDGTAVITGNDVKLAFDIEAWRNLIKVEVGNDFCIGLRIDGRVVASGDNFFSQCDVSLWNDILDIKVSGVKTFGLRADGKVLFTGYSEFGDDEFLRLFDNIVEIACNKKQIMLLDTNGNVFVSKHPEGLLRTQLNDWVNIKHIETFNEEFIGLKEDGTIVTTFSKETELSKWSGVKDIVVNDMYISGKIVNYAD